jgi:hypothetical protein
VFPGSDLQDGRVPTLTIISKPDCHLCDVAREIVDLVVADLPEDEVQVEEFSILDDPELYRQWWEKIPVILIDDRLHAHWRLDAGRLRAALRAPAETDEGDTA